MGPVPLERPFECSPALSPVQGPESHSTKHMHIKGGCSAEEDNRVPSPCFHNISGQPGDRGLLWKSPLRFALTIKELLQVKSQEPPWSPAGHRHAQPLGSFSKKLSQNCEVTTLGLDASNIVFQAPKNCFSKWLSLHADG